MRRVKSYTYDRSKMTQDRLNHFMIMISLTSQRDLLGRMDADNKHLVTSIDLSSCSCINLNELKCVWCGRGMLGVAPLIINGLTNQTNLPPPMPG